VKSPGDIPASLRQRLLNRSMADRGPFNELNRYQAMERFLYSISIFPALLQLFDPCANTAGGGRGL
jgi:hypothetical protein